MKQKIHKIGYIIIFFTLFTILFVTNSSNFIVFAQENNSTSASSEPGALCDSSSPEFEDYLSFAQEIADILEGTPNKPKSSSQIDISGLFSEEYLSASKAIKYAMNKATFLSTQVNSLISAGIGATVSSTLTLRGMSRNLWSSFLILFKKYPFKRDWDKLQRIDTRFNRLVFELNTKNKWFAKIDEKTLQKLNTTSEKYVSNNHFFQEIRYGTDLKYSRLVLVMLNFVKYMKKFLMSYDSDVEYFSNYLNTKKNNFQIANEIMLVPNNTIIENMTRKYLNLRNGAICNTKLGSFFKDINILGRIKDDLDKSMKQMNTSVKKLTTALHGIKVRHTKDKNGENNNLQDVLTSEQMKILREIYGVDVSRLSKGQGIGLSDIFRGKINVKTKTEGNFKTMLKQNITKPWSKFSKAMKLWHESYKKQKTGMGFKNGFSALWTTIKSGVKEIFNGGNKIEEKKVEDAIKKADEYTRKTENDSNSEKRKKQELEDVFNKTTKEIISAHQQANLETETNNSIKNFDTFYRIGKVIQEIDTELLGEKSTKHSINQILVNTCEKQCTNKPGICYSNLIHKITEVNIKY